MKNLKLGSIKFRGLKTLHQITTINLFAFLTSYILKNLIILFLLFHYLLYQKIASLAILGFCKQNLFNLKLNFLFLKDHKIDSSTKKSLFDRIDFHKLNEETLENCKDSEHIPAEHVSQAALALCTKLRRELDEANLKLKALNIRSRPSRDSSYSSILNPILVKLFSRKKLNISSG